MCSFRYTGDPDGLIPRFFERIQGRTWMLIARREYARRLNPQDPAYGMLTGNYEGGEQYNYKGGKQFKKNTC